MSVDSELERLLEEFDAARRRMDTRLPLIQEALDELPHATSVRFTNYLGFGRELPVTDDVRVALGRAALEERETLVADYQKARERVMARRQTLVDLG